MSEVKSQYLVRINYKSGAFIEAWFDEFEVSHIEGEVQNVTWLLSSHQQQNIIIIGTKCIESIMQLAIRPREDVL